MTPSEITNTLSDDQKKAFEFLNKWIKDKKKNTIVTIRGYAGTGKTYLIKKFIEYHLKGAPFGYNVVCSAPTNKAVKVLQDTGEIGNVEYLTIHKLLGIKRQIDDQGREIFIAGSVTRNIDISSCDVLVVDEVSMMNDELFEEVYKYRDKAKIIFMGDPAQIPPVNQLDAIPFSQVDKYDIETVELKQIMRQAEGSNIVKFGMSLREKLSVNNPNIIEHEGNDFVITSVVDSEDRKSVDKHFRKVFQSKKYEEDSDYCKIICWRNNTIDTYNNYIRRIIFGEDVSSKIVKGERLIINKPINDGPIMVLQTNQEVRVTEYKICTDVFEKESLKYYLTHVEYYDVDVKGMSTTWIRILHEDSEKDFNKVVDKLKSIAINTQQKKARKQKWKLYYQFIEYFSDVSYSYAITAHKSQGSTYNSVILAFDDIMYNKKVRERNRILYTASSRAKNNLMLLTRMIRKDKN